MITYHEKMFVDLLERFKKEQLSELKREEKKDDERRKVFIAEYPKDSIISMQMENYLISREEVGNSDSFCRRICTELKTYFHINISNKWEDTFGISLKNGTQLALSEPYASVFGSDYDKAFLCIKNDIIDLLKAIDKDDYEAVGDCKLSNNFKYMLLIIYFPKKILPVHSSTLLFRYCECIGIKYRTQEEMVYTNNALLKWKNDVPELANWSNTIFAGFCDWLYRKNQTLDGNMLSRDARLNLAEITEEIEGLNLQGKSKEAVIKVRINQGIFRVKLLQRYSKCCLCGVSDKNLLVASHIKPWSESQSNEKLDCDNGFLMCPNHDKLFDKGWITFDNDGNIVIADRLTEEDRISLNVRDNMKISLTEKNKEYLQFHRKHVFKNI